MDLRTFSCVKAAKNNTASSIYDEEKKKKKNHRDKDRNPVLIGGLRGSVCQWGKEIKHTIS